MTDKALALRALQAWMQASITHPRGLGAAPLEVAGFITATSRQTAAERLTVYHRAYFARLVECLRGMFPILAKTLGDAAFGEVAVAYLDVHPSTSYTLDHVGDAFVKFLRETRPLREREGTPDWADFMIELSELELAFEHVFDGLGHEGEPLLSSVELANIEPQTFATAKLKLTPSLRLLDYQFPVNDYFSAAREGAPPDLPGPQATWLAVYRRDYIVRRQPLSVAAWELLHALAAHNVVAAVTDVGSRHPIEASELRRWFEEWSAAQIITGIMRAEA